MLAVYVAIRKAREIAVDQGKPVLVETMSYRGSHHSTSDDSSRYRDSDEVQRWRARDPISRHRRWMISQGWWSDEMEAEVRDQARQEVGWHTTVDHIHPPHSFSTLSSRALPEKSYLP